MRLIDLVFISAWLIKAEHLLRFAKGFDGIRVFASLVLLLAGLAKRHNLGLVCGAQLRSWQCLIDGHHIIGTLGSKNRSHEPNSESSYDQIFTHLTKSLPVSGGIAPIELIKD